MENYFFLFALLNFINWTWELSGEVVKQKVHLLFCFLFALITHQSLKSLEERLEKKASKTSKDKWYVGPQRNATFHCKSFHCVML